MNIIKTVTGDDRNTRQTQAVEYATQYAARFGATVTVVSGMYDHRVVTGEHAGVVVRPNQSTVTVAGVAICVTTRDSGLFAALPSMSPERAHMLLQSVRVGAWAIGSSETPGRIGASI